MHKKARKQAATRSAKGVDASTAVPAAGIDRRQFVRTASGLVIGTAVASGCGEDEVTGTVLVSVTGLGAGATSGGTATVNGPRLAAPLVMTLIPGESTYEKVPVGVYSVSYEAPSGYALAPGSAAVRTDVEVAVDATTPVSFALLVAAGTIRSVVAGHDVSGANAGSLTILRIDIPAQVASQHTILPIGTHELGVSAGTFRITYGAPSGHVLVAGSAPQREVTVTAGELEIVPFSVQQVSSTPSGIVFHSDWNTALGTTATAFRDTGKTKPWNYHCCDSNTNSSIATAASLALTNWPTPNVYRVGTMAASPSSIPTHILEVDLGLPSAGSHRYFRYYLQVTHGDIHGNGTSTNYEHGVETADTGGGDGMCFYRIPRSNGTWFPGYCEISSGWRWVGTGLSLQKNRTYRMEWHLAFSASTYTVQVRITDVATNTVVATEANFHRLLPAPEDNSIPLTGIQFTYLPADHRFFRVGTNGPTSNFPMTNLVNQNLFLAGAVAISDSDWVGAYANGI